MENRILSALFVCLAFANAQTTSQINGTVTDRTSASVTGAKVTITNRATQAVRELSTDEAGLFQAPLLQPGTYSVRVEKPGFKAAVQDSITLEVNQVARLDFALEVGNVTESVEVRESVPLLDSDTSSVGQVIETKQIVDLPLNGRNFVQLAILGPGVTGAGYGAAGTIMSGTRPDDQRPGSELFSNGNREGSNNHTYDGIDNNERLTLSITLRPSVEAVREFKIQTNMFAAEQGRNAGATVNVVSKSGTNEWHGSAYEFLRNAKMDAKEFFARPDLPTPAFQQNQFGGSFGGPIVRNKLFFFANYEGFTKRRELTSVNTVPIEAVRRGDFSGVRDIYDPTTVRPQAGTASGFVRDPFPGRQIPLQRFDPITLKLLNAYPLPQRAGLVNNHTTNPKEKQRWDQGDGRVDWNASEKNQIFGRYSRQDTITTKPSTFAPVNIPGISVPVSLGSEATFAGDSVLIAHHAVVGWTRTFTPRFLMEARAGFQRFNLDFQQEGSTPGARLGEQLGVVNSNQGPRSDGIPIFSPSDYQGIGQTRSLPIIRRETSYQASVNFTNVGARHTLKYGYDIKQRRLTIFQTNRGNGRFNFSPAFTTNPNQTANTGDSMASFILGTPSVIEQDFLLAFVGMFGWEHGVYFQDDWRVTRNLTLNLGIRYEYDTPYTEQYNRWTNFDLTTGKLLIAGVNTDARAGIQPDKNNWAPRLGFAYQAAPKTVIRGGAGVFYNVQGSESVMLRLHRQLPFGPINALNIDQFNANPRRVSDGLPAIPVLDPNIVINNPTGNLLAVTPNFKHGYVYQYNFQVQHELPGNMVAKAGYVGSVSRQLDNVYNANQQDPGPGTPASRRPLRNIAPNVVNVDLAVSDGRANYNSLQLSLEKRYSAGLSLLTAYTWAHAIDNVANAFGGAANGPLPQDPRYRNVDRATSGFDIQHRFTTSINYELPIGKGKALDFGNPVGNLLLGGWQTNGIFTWQTGLPFTPVLNNAVANAGGSRPDVLRAESWDNRDPARWFDTSFNTPDAVWGVPRQFTYGNGGRNILRGPGRVNLDFSLFKNFAITERFNLQLRAEAYNIFNTPQFGLPNANIGSPAAGTITGIVGNPRQMQVAMRLSF